MRRPLVLALAVTVSTLAVLWGTTNLAGDRTVLVPPPHARAQNFMHALATRRAELVLKDLAPPVRTQVSAVSLQARFDALVRPIGGVTHVEAATIVYDDRFATVRVELLGGEGRTPPFEMRFAWMHGEWFVQALPEGLAEPVRYTR